MQVSIKTYSSRRVPFRGRFFHYCNVIFYRNNISINSFRTYQITTRQNPSNHTLFEEQYLRNVVVWRSGPRTWYSGSVFATLGARLLCRQTETTGAITVYRTSLWHISGIVFYDFHSKQISTARQFGVITVPISGSRSVELRIRISYQRGCISEGSIGNAIIQITERWNTAHKIDSSSWLCPAPKKSIDHCCNLLLF